MKKLLVLMLVLGMASFANAAVISLVRDGVGSNTNTGTSTDPLDSGETIHLQLVLNYVSGSHPNYSGDTYPYYNGYTTDGIDITVRVTGGGSIGADGTQKAQGFKPAGGAHADFDLANYHGYEYKTGSFMWDIGDTDGDETVDLSQALRFSMGSTSMVEHDGTDGESLVWDFYVTCTGGTTPMTVVLIVNGGRYYDFAGDPTSTTLTNSDVEGLDLHQVPEPATVALLGLGALLLKRRRR
jgi:hypothetical protein